MFSIDEIINLKSFPNFINYEKKYFIKFFQNPLGILFVIMLGIYFDFKISIFAIITLIIMSLFSYRFDKKIFESTENIRKRKNEKQNN